MTVTASTFVNEDDFMSLAQTIKYQNKDNKELVGKLNKLIVKLKILHLVLITLGFI